MIAVGSIAAAVCRVIAEGPGTWFCTYCSAPFDSLVALAAHMANCGYDKR